MSVRTILLRVLLSVALISSGGTGAVASVHMTYGSTEEAATAAEASAAELPCHTHRQATSPTASSNSPAAVPASPPEPEPPAPDCCKSGACRGACMHSAPVAVLPMTAFIPAMAEHARSIPPMSLDHADPALPHLIRPPIG